MLNIFSLIKCELPHFSVTTVSYNNNKAWRSIYAVKSAKIHIFIFITICSNVLFDGEVLTAT